MAYSSLLSFLQDPLVPHSRRSDAALKRYESAKDPRAWSLDTKEKANFIHEIVKRKAECESSSDGNETLMIPGTGVDDIDGMSREQLLKLIRQLYSDLKTKDVELDKIHNLFKQASKKLEDMNEIVNESRKVESKLKESETKLQQLKQERQKKDEKIKSMQQCSPSVKVETAKASSEMLDEVVKERDKLKESLCRMMGVSQILHNLRTRADQADELETENCSLKRELQRYGYGAAGDTVPKNPADSSCRQCDKYADDLNRSESVLESEIERSYVTEAERNILRERVRALEVKEAESILYKTKYDEAECKILKLKEMLLKAEGNEKQIRDLQQRLTETELHLNEAHRRAEEMITIVERQDLDLNERDVYIGNLNRRVQQGVGENSLKKVVSIDCLPPGKVQSIIQQMSYEPGNANCKCSFENCQCGIVKEKRASISKSNQSNCTAKASVDTCIPGEVATASRNLEMSPVKSCNSMHQHKSLAMSEASRLQEEISSDEIRLLRQQNAQLDQQLKSYKEELEKMSCLMNEVEQQRESNNSMEKDVKQLSSTHEKELENEKTSFQMSLCEKENELCELQSRLNKESAEMEKLEKRLAAHCEEIKQLRPLLRVQERCHNLEETLNCAKSNEDKRLKELECLQGDCSKLGEEKKHLVKQINELKFELEEQRKYAASLADQLCNLQNRKEKCQKHKDPTDNKEMLRKNISDLKKDYEALKQEKMNMAHCFEDKLNLLQEENRALKIEQNGKNVVKECECDWSISGGCDDVLLRKLSKFGLKSLQRDELIDLHYRVRVAMLKLKKSTPMGSSSFSFDYYTRMADELRINHKLSNALGVTSDDPENTPVKDIDTSSSKTLPSILSKSSKVADNKLRGRSSSEVNLKAGSEAAGKCADQKQRKN